MKSKTSCADCNTPITEKNFYLYADGRYSTYCKPCNTKRSVNWKRNNRDKSKKHGLKHINGNERNFVNATIGRIFKPSVMFPKKERSYQRKGWIPEATKEEIYAELLIHIQLMKEKFPESDGRICRYCEKPWTYIRSGNEPGSINIKKTNFSMDRFNSNITYKIGNIIFCCNGCNSLKNGSTKEMWIKFLEIDKEINQTKEKA